MQALIGRGVIGDFRTPDILRFGLTPLYLRYVDIIDAVENLFEVMDKKLYRAPQYQLRRAVT
jgi:kynureninase